LLDVRDLINLDDVMSELELGPNGGLVYCMEYLLDNMDWLEDAIADFDEDYLLIDCPGQVELYTHLPVMRVICEQLQKLGYRVCAVSCIDATFLIDSSRFIAASMHCLSTMIQMQLPHINLLTKCDLIPNKALLRTFYDPDMSTLVHDLNRGHGERFKRLNVAIAEMVIIYVFFFFYKCFFFIFYKK